MTDAYQRVGRVVDRIAAEHETTRLIIDPKLAVLSIS